jgi:hypothetical protein
MSQHDFDIANQTASNARVDINLALKALGSLSSGATAPTTTYANMLWYDTGANILKMRSEADDVWISVGYLNQSTDEFSLFDDTKVVNSSGTQTGLIGDQATSAWEAGTSTTESLVSPAKVAAAIEALVVIPDVNPIGDSQSWATASRSSGVSYQNTTGRSVQISLSLEGYSTGGEGGTDESTQLQVSTDGSTWVTIISSQAGFSGVGYSSAIIPDTHYYRYIGTSGNSSGVISSFAILS